MSNINITITTRQVITLLRADRDALRSKARLTSRDRAMLETINESLRAVTRAYRGEVAARKIVAAFTK